MIFVTLLHWINAVTIIIHIIVSMYICVTVYLCVCVCVSDSVHACLCLHLHMYLGKTRDVGVSETTRADGISTVR